MEKIQFVKVLALLLLGFLVPELSAADNYTTVRLQATGALKELISPNFPSNYPFYENIMYILTANDSHNGIVIKFSYFMMESSPNCEADSLKLYKANYAYKFLVKRYCGHKKPKDIFIPENNVTLVFTTNGHQEKRGFRLKYYATRTNPFKKSQSNCDTGGITIPGVVAGFGICTILVILVVIYKNSKRGAEKQRAEAKKKAETGAKKKAETEAKTKVETEAKTIVETEAKNKVEAEKKEENTIDNQAPKCKEKQNAKNADKVCQEVNHQSTQTFIQPVNTFNQSAYGMTHPLMPINPPAQPRTQPLPPINESIHSISQHFPPNTLPSHAQPLLHPIEMLYPSIQGEHSHPIHLVQPVSNTTSFTRPIGGTGASDGIHNHRSADVYPPSYDALNFDYNIPETKLL